LQGLAREFPDSHEISSAAQLQTEKPIFNECILMNLPELQPGHDSMQDWSAKSDVLYGVWLL
jgi:hypothetical protein